MKSLENILFFHEKWLGPITLGEKYTLLLELKSRKKCIVADRILNGCFKGHWKYEVEDEGDVNNLEKHKRDLS